MPSARTQRTYDHRLICLVQQTGDATIATPIDTDSAQGQPATPFRTTLPPR